MTQLKSENGTNGLGGRSIPSELEMLEALLAELRGVLVHIRNSAAPNGYIYRVTENAIEKCDSWK